MSFIVKDKDHRGTVGVAYMKCDHAGCETEARYLSDVVVPTGWVSLGDSRNERWLHRCPAHWLVPLVGPAS